MTSIPTPLAWAHPLVREWFSNKFGSPTEPQEQGWPSILAGYTTLISAPTGSGKTFAAFLICIDKLVRQALAGNLGRQTEVLYVSPLKALTNDVQKNLLEPLSEIQQLAKDQGYSMEEIEVAVRTGDTLARDRQAMLKKPPHILVTTPESFYLLLTAEKSRAMLSTVQTLIVDEIHALANNKRGSHLSLSMERLDAITLQKPVRIGLSATQKPLSLVADFLAGSNSPTPSIINIGHARQLELTVEVPEIELGPIASNAIWDQIYDRIAELARQNRSTLVFANTRRLAERVAHHLSERLGKEKVAAHHGSLSRKLRLAAEHNLKTGQLQVLVATASLELGIDIGTVDLVCQLGSPRAIAIALQRIGRAGHWHGAISKGIFFATTTDELLECAALVYAIRSGDLDRLLVPEEPLDILAQQIVASCATNDWQEEQLFALVKQSHPYKDLTRETFNSILEILAEGIAGSRGRYGSYLFRDQINGLVKARRGSRLTAITSGGAIPETNLFTVITESTGTVVGTLDEDFAIESNRGDIILLGNTSWQIKGIESKKGRMLVEDAHGAPPTVPFWVGEAPARTEELSLHLSNLRKTINTMLTSKEDSQAASTWLTSHCGLTKAAAEQIIHYILTGRALLGTVPTQETIIAERFFDESGGMQLIIHSPFGARINKAWGLALRKRFCRSFNFELQAAATDNGIAIALAEQHSFPLADVFDFLHPNTLSEVLTQAVLQSPIFTTRWRWVAMRSLALVRFRGGRKVPPNILRMLSDDLLAAVFPDAAACQDNLAGQDIELPEHPLIIETMKDCLTEAMDLQGLTKLLETIKAGKIDCIAVDTPTPSVFSHEILNANPYAFLDDAPLEERRARAVEMRRVLPDSLVREFGRLDPAAITEVQQQVWPDLRNADELHDLLQTLIALPVEIQLNEIQKSAPLWSVYFAELVQQGRAGKAFVAEREFWLATEKFATFRCLYPAAVFHNQFLDLGRQAPEHAEALTEAIRGWLQYLGPTSQPELAAILQLSHSDIEQTLLQLEATGLVLRGHFRTMDKEQLEWCERRLLARIHALTLGILRKEIEPVTAVQFVNWLLNWQHLSPGSQVRGERGLLEVIKQLQGFEIPANAWEKQVFAKRVIDYDKDWLDRLCFTGVIGWGRLSPHPVILANNEDQENTPAKRITPTSISPITFFVREDSAWMAGMQQFNQDDLQVLSHVAQSIYAYLRENGASFFNDILQEIGHLRTEVEIGLWELVSAGIITADGFDNLRALIDPKRRNGRPRHRVNYYHQASGRWSLLKTPKAIAPEQQMEAICMRLLKRYGVCFRELLVKEKIIPSWRDLLISFRRMEAKGEIRGGRFVSGFAGEQFALPYAVDSLRAFRKKDLDSEIIAISAIDPLNLVGLILPGKRVPSFSGKEVNFK
ncbi:putative DEAD-box ATP-dependent RNA helicase [Legionella massiliensis]|uniref:Putative DEAD-box ATP-dependent RNA helicase n=1 Tax=Legionella massiliensis TaxID=1034943 RepID=A0A078KZW5_9GAMM|nr:DEAD/DEAH box helicase [Legionella massiliensis]CDZ78552.1 putative DEAD-box ATP-dependent RNA helicase [Legionella massiliensis]CEE14290.1 putative DEAD-box ATP-dependent RNA helicase [Legionella massiliensis]